MNLKNQADYIIDLEKHLISVDILDLTRRIKEFRSLNFRKLNDEELAEAILRVLLYNNSFMYFPNVKSFPKGTNFFRVRKLSGSVIPIANFKTYSDLWEPPKEVLVNYGRLNKPNESLLYTSFEPEVAIKETHISENDFYALIKYTAKDIVKVNFIGDDYDYNALGLFNTQAITVHEIYNNFLRDEFSRDVGQGTEFLYRISERIAKDYFDLPPREMQDAWGYGSVYDKNKYNVCFRPEIAHDLLEVKGAVICKKDATDSIHVKCIALCCESGEIQYFKLGSVEQKIFFPEIIVG